MAEKRPASVADLGGGPLLRALPSVQLNLRKRRIATRVLGIRASVGPKASRHHLCDILLKKRARDIADG